MTVTLELKADEVRALQEIAHIAGTTVEAVLHALIAQVSPARNEEAKITEAESAEVSADDPEADDPEAAAERRRGQKEVEANIRRWHEEQRAA